MKNWSGIINSMHTKVKTKQKGQHKKSRSIPEYLASLQSWMPLVVHSLLYSYIKLREQIRQNDIGNICATSGAGTAYLSGASVFTIGF